MLEFLSISNLFLLGFLLSLFFHKEKKGVVLDWLFILKSVVWSILLISLVGILLLEFSQFHLKYFHIIFGILNIILLASNWKQKKLKVTLPQVKVTVFSTLFILLIALNIFLKTPVSNHIHGGQDQGVYINTANELAETGDIWIEESLMKEAFTNENAHFLQKYYKVYKETPVRDGRYEGWRTPGYYITDKEQGGVISQFYHLSTVWFALSSMIFGTEGTAFPLVLFSILSLPLMYLFLNVFVGNKWISLGVVGMYSINLLTVWVSKYPLSEVAAFFFLLIGLYYLYMVYQDTSKKLPLQEAMISGLAFGLFAFVRGDGLLFLPVFAFIYFFLPHKKQYTVLFNIFFIMLLWSTLHAMYFSFPYFFDVFGALWPGLFEQNYFLVFTGLFLAFIASINVFKYLLRNITTKCLQLCGKIPAKIYILVAAPFVGIFLSKMYAFFTQISQTGVVDMAMIEKNIHRIVIEGETFGLGILHLLVFVTPLLLVCALYGMYKLMKHKKGSWMLMAFFLFAAFFQYVYIVEQGGLMYYARYQFAVLFPSMFIFFAAFLKNYHTTEQWKSYAKYLVAILVTCSYLFTAWTNPIYAKVEIEDAYESVEQLVTHIRGENPVVFMDSSMIPRFGAPMMYTFHKGVVLNNDNLFAVYEEGKQLMELFNRSVYLLEEDKIEEKALYHQDLGLELISQGTLPIHVSEGSTKIPKVWHESDPPYYLYKLGNAENVGNFEINTLSITPTSSLYEFQGLYGLNDGTYAWTDGHLIIKNVPLYIFQNDTYSEVLLRVINSGHFPPSVTLTLEILVNGERACIYNVSGEKILPLAKCKVQEKFYNANADIEIISNTWVPAEIWSHSANTSNLGIDFQELQIEFVK